MKRIRRQPVSKPSHRCKFYGKNPKAQERFGYPPCDLATRKCANFKHPDCNKAGVLEFEDTPKGLAYANLNRNRFIHPSMKYDATTKSMMKNAVSEIHTLEHTLTHTNAQTNFTHISETQRDRPCVILKLSDENSKTFESLALIDPASYTFTNISSNNNEENILSYISTKLANEINEIHTYAAHSCKCKPATTCTSTGCFISNNCIKLECILYDNSATTEKITISFRIVETLGNNDIIIGLSDVRKYDLTTKFKHIYKNTQKSQKSSSYRQALNVKYMQARQLANRQGKDLRESNAQLETSDSEAKHATPQDPETSYRGLRHPVEFLCPNTSNAQ